MAWRVVYDLDRRLWGAFVAEHPRSTIFHTPEMQEVFAATPGHTPVTAAAVDDRGHPVALLTVVRISLWGGPAAPFTTRAVAYGGFLAEDGARGREALAALLSDYNRRAGGAMFTELRHMHDPRPWQEALQRSGYAWEPHLNFLISLEGGEDAVWRRFKRNTRHKIRQAEAHGLVAREVTGEEELAWWYDLVQDVYRRVRVPLAPRALFAAALERLVPRGQARFWLAWHGDTPVAARAALLHRDTILDWYAGDRVQYRHLRPNDFLVWHVLRWGIAQGYRVFDFGGAGHPDRPYGVRDFKAKFGGERVNYGRSTCVHHPWRLRLSRAAYALWQRLR